MPDVTGTLRPPRLAAAPSSPVAGQIYFNTADNALYWWTGTAWVSARERVLQIKVVDDTTGLTTGDGKAIVCVSDDLNGLVLVDADAYVTTNSSSGTPTVAIRRIRSGTAVDMLSTNITIDANEPTSYTAAVQPVLNTANDDVLTGDLIAVDVDVAGTGAKGLGVVLAFA